MSTVPDKSEERTAVISTAYLRPTRPMALADKTRIMTYSQKPSPLMAVMVTMAGDLAQRVQNGVAPRTAWSLFDGPARHFYAFRWSNAARAIHLTIEATGNSLKVRLNACTTDVPEHLLDYWEIIVMSFPLTGDDWDLLDAHRGSYESSADDIIDLVVDESALAHVQRIQRPLTWPGATMNEVQYREFGADVIAVTQQYLHLLDLTA